LEELGSLADSFNDMAAKLKTSFDKLFGEVETRKSRERELADSEARLRASEARWRSVFESSTLGVILTDRNYRVLETNRALQTMLDYTSQELRSLSPTDLMVEEEHEAARQRFAELREGTLSSYEVVTRYRRKDGSPIWVNTFVSTIPGDENREPIYLATAIDITDRYNAESELRRYATYLAEAEKLSHTGCWARNLGTGEMFWSEEQWRIFHLNPETTRLTHEMFLKLVHPEDRAPFEEISQRAVENNEAYDIPFRALIGNGTIKYLHHVGKPSFETAGQVVEYIGVTMDETDRIRASAAAQEAQAELARVARLTTMGELAASIAHEINQPLAAVIASGNAALRWLARAEPNLQEAKEALSAVVKEGNRASDVIGRVRALLRNRKPEYEPLDINEAIREVLGFTGHALRSRDVAVQLRLPAGLPLALGDRVQLQQVIMNLIMNGADAMASVSERPRILQIEAGHDDGRSVLVSIRDSGTGIDEDILQRIFEPLFTTKSTGMGMGLSICRSIVEAHGGRLWASAAQPYGTDFQFTVPVSDGGTDPA
jgi:PAS domain S-box-containing protein